MADTPEQQETNGKTKPPKKGFFKKTLGRGQAILGWGAIKDNANFISDSAKSIISVQKEQHNESFEQAKSRLHLSDADIAERKQSFLKLALIMGAFGVMVLVYTVYLLWNAYFDGALLAFTVSLLCLATACRYHFWYFQVKNQKLGCSLKEWLNAKVGGEK